MLEKMADFFSARLAGYEEHQLTCIEGAREFYPFTASILPRSPGAQILDLGCGTGLELDLYLTLNPSAAVTGIDLSAEMLDALGRKHPEVTLLCGSYFDLPLGEDRFDAAVSVESLHHFTKDQKVTLYRKLHRSLRPGGFFVLTDYLCETDDQETFFRSELARLKREQGLADGEFYHYDTPLTVPHETEALREGGFREVRVMDRWENTYTLLAEK